jgi:hypothetical protein
MFAIEEWAKEEPSRLSACFCLFPAWLTSRHWKWRQYIPPKHWFLSESHGITTRKTSVFMKSPIFWDITPCRPLKVNWRFGGTFRLHLEGRISREQDTSVKAGGKVWMHNGASEGNSVCMGIRLERIVPWAICGESFPLNNLSAELGPRIRPHKYRS